MKRYLVLIYLIICALATPSAFSQQLSFESTSFNFGTIAEAGGDVSHAFKYKNESEKPIVIITSQTSCGCTTPEYTRRPITPGQSGEVKITYDPMYRPGRFAKEVKIITSASNTPLVLTILGDVTEREKSVEEEYPFEMGSGLRIGSNYYALSQVEQGAVKEAQVSYINTSDKTISLAVREVTKSGYLYIKAPKSIAPGEKGSFAVGYSLKSDKPYYGSLADTFQVVVNDNPARYEVKISGHAVDKFNVSEFNGSASAVINKRFLKFASLKHGSTSEKMNFTIQNSGIKPMHIRSVELHKGVHTSLKATEVIAPGQSLTVDVWVSTKGYDYGAFSSYVTLTVDDAVQPIQRVRVTGIIED